MSDENVIRPPFGTFERTPEGTRRALGLPCWRVMSGTTETEVAGEGRITQRIIGAVPPDGLRATVYVTADASLTTAQIIDAVLRINTHLFEEEGVL